MQLQSWIRYLQHVLPRPCLSRLSRVLWWVMAEDSSLCHGYCVKHIQAPERAFERSPVQELHSTTTSSPHQLKVVKDSRAMGHKLGRGPPHFLGLQSLGSCCVLGGTVDLNPSTSADPAFPNNFVGLAGDSWLHRGQALWRRVSRHLLLLLCKQSHGTGKVRAAHKKDCRLTGGWCGLCRQHFTNQHAN